MDTATPAAGATPWWRSPWVLGFVLGAVGLTATRSCFRHVPEAPPVSGEVPALAAITTDGEPAEGWSRPGEVWILGLFCGEPTEACTSSNAAMRKVALALRATDEAPIHLVSVWPGATGDAAKAARRVVTQTRAWLPEWDHVLVADGDALLTALSAARVASGDVSDAPAWTRLVLVDGAGGIRGFYAHDREEVVSELYHRVEHVRSATGTGG